MKIFITSFNNIRYFKENMIPVSTALGWPWWLYKDADVKVGEYYVDKHNIMIGISDERLHFNKDAFEEMEEKCQKNCPYINKIPNCQFMTEYLNHLRSLDFSKIIEDLKITGEEVRKVTKYKGEPIIVLMVYEAASCPCAERPILRKWFEENGYKLPEWTRS